MGALGCMLAVCNGLPNLRERVREMMRPAPPDDGAPMGAEPLGDYQRKTQSPIAQFEKTEIPSADSFVVQHALRARCYAEAWRTQRQRKNVRRKLICASTLDLLLPMA